MGANRIELMQKATMENGFNEGLPSSSKPYRTIFVIPPHLATRYLMLFLLVHTLLWTLGPYWTRHSLPHDTLESITWGMQWQLGYHKHPFLTAWLCAGITQLLGHIDLPAYFLAQLAILTTFVATWQLAKAILPTTHALIATLALDGVLFYNINSFNLTPDTLQSPLWAMLCLSLYYALTQQKLHHWLITGLIAGLCVCTKYQVIVLFIPLMLFFLCNSEARGHFYRSGPYWAIAVFLLCITPHLVWLYQHHFITVIHAGEVSSEYTTNQSPFNYIQYPLRLLANALLCVADVFILLWPFYTNKKECFTLTSLQQQFLLTISVGPLLLTLFLCTISGDYFPPRWLTPYFFSIGIVVIAYLKPQITLKKIKQFTWTLICLSLLLFVARMINFTLIPRASSDTFLPNQELAKSLTTLWHNKYHRPLPYIAGSNYLVSLVTPYMIDKPKPYFNWLSDESPWVNEKELYRAGALFVWDEGHHYIWDKDSARYTHLPKSVIHRFPTLEINPPLFTPRISDNNLVVIGVAILPPLSE